MKESEQKKIAHRVNRIIERVRLLLKKNVSNTQHADKTATTPAEQYPDQQKELSFRHSLIAEKYAFVCRVQVYAEDVEQPHPIETLNNELDEVLQKISSLIRYRDSVGQKMITDVRREGDPDTSYILFEEWLQRNRFDQHALWAQLASIHQKGIVSIDVPGDQANPSLTIQLASLIHSGFDSPEVASAIADAQSSSRLENEDETQWFIDKLLSNLSWNFVWTFLQTDIALNQTLNSESPQCIYLAIAATEERFNAALQAAKPTVSKYAPRYFPDFVKVAQLQLGLLARSSGYFFPNYFSVTEASFLPTTSPDEVNAIFRKKTELEKQDSRYQGAFVRFQSLALIKHAVASYNGIDRFSTATSHPFHPDLVYNMLEQIQAAILRIKTNPFPYDESHMPAAYGRLFDQLEPQIVLIKSQLEPLLVHTRTS